MKPEVKSCRSNQAEQVRRRGREVLKTPFGSSRKRPSAHLNAHSLSETQRIALAYSLSIPANLTASPVIWHFKPSTTAFVRSLCQQGRCRSCVKDGKSLGACANAWEAAFKNPRLQKREEQGPPQGPPHHRSQNIFPYAAWTPADVPV